MICNVRQNLRVLCSDLSACKLVVLSFCLCPVLCSACQNNGRDVTSTAYADNLTSNELALKCANSSPELRNALKESFRKELYAEFKEKERELLKEEIRVEMSRETKDELLDPELPPNDAPRHEITPPEHVGFAQNTETETRAEEYPPLPPSQEIEKDEKGLKVLRHELTSKIVRRQPIEAKDDFKLSGGPVYCFVEVSSVYDAERMLTLRWVHSSGISQSYDLAIGQSPAWRTWSKLNTTSSMKGRWNCEVFNESGTLLSVATFQLHD